MVRRVGVLVLVLGLAVFGEASALAQGEVTEKSQELDDLRARIKHHRRKATDLSQDEKRQLERLSEIEKELALTGELLDRLAAREQEIALAIELSASRVDSVEVLVAARKDKLAERLRSMYKRPRGAGLSSLMGASSVQSFAAGLKVLTHVARAERRIIEQTRTLHDELYEEQVRRNEALAELQATRSEAESRRIELAALDQERRATLQKLRRERKGYEASAREMEKAASELADLIARLEARGTRRQISTDFARNQGALPWPVQGPVVRGFGKSIHPEFKTTVMNKGINIGASMGAPIRAVAPGIVDFVDWLPGYGKCLIVNHGDGFYTLYAHALELFPEEGAELAAGDVVGEVGDSGSLEGSQLYFEVRRGKNALDPMLWLSRPSR